MTCHMDVLNVTWQVGSSLAGGIQTDEILSSSSVSLPAGLTRAFVMGKEEEREEEEEEEEVYNSGAQIMTRGSTSI